MPADPLLPIGAFSRLAHLSSHALRHYHDVGLLVPAEVDPRTGYRRYSPAQADTAHLIRRLRALDMPLDEVAAAVAAPGPDRERLISAHLARMEDELDRTRRAVASLRLLLAAGDAGPDVEVRRVPETPALVCRAEMTADDIDAWCAATFPRLHHAVASAGRSPAGPPGGLYAEAWFAEGAGQVTAFLPVAAEGWEPDDGLALAVLPAGEVAVAVHEGPFSELDRTYGALGRFVVDAGLDAPGPIVERYLVGPDTSPDPSGWRTEVCWPVRT